MKFSNINKKGFQFSNFRKNNPLTTGLSMLLICLMSLTITGQNEGNENAADRTLRGNGRVNASTLAMEFDLPLASYPGRGINVPIGLSYSSKLWRMKSLGRTPVPGGNSSSCYDHYTPLFAEDTASGWTTSLAVPFIEYTGLETFYDNDGSPITYGDSECPSTQGTTETFAQYYIKRILVHLPSGETHELRASDAKTMFLNWNDSNAPDKIWNWNETYYAADGSNIVYVQNSNTGVYRLLMPDGSYYDFDGSAQHGSDRKATKFTDRNGNFTTYYGPGSVDNNGVTHPNGYWKDTLGRNLSIPVGLSPPSIPTPSSQPQIYSVPGLGGTSSVQYKLHWKKLKGSTASESALTNFSDALKYPGDRYVGGPGACGNTYSAYCHHPNNAFLFGDGDAVIVSNTLFNPVLLSEIELPTGQRYKFSYDVYGRIDKISYPTGGEEYFTYNVVPTLSVLEPGSIGGQSNFGVTNRKVYASSGGPFYEWNYSAAYVQPKGYKVTITNPDETKVERFLHRGYDSGSDLGKFGYDNGLAGMQYEQRSYDKSGTAVSRSLTHWTTSQFAGSAALADWHPRVTHDENYIFKPNGNGEFVWSTAKYEYEDLTSRDKPLLRNKVLQYGFQSGSGSSNLVPPGGSPDPNPTPVPTPVPPNLLRTSETTYFINDSTIPQTTRDLYYSIANLKNIVGMVSASVVKDSSGTVVSRSEMKYDDPGYSPGNFVRGNPTRSRVWDSTKGAYTNPNAYIETKAKFDDWGNQYESIDAKGNSTITVFDSTHHVFPVQVTSAVPDPSGQNGSSTPFVTTSTFDPTTGLPLSTFDANGLETRITYDPATLRPTNAKTYYQNNQVGSETETIYFDEPGNYRVKTRSKIDAENWAENISYFDGLGRAYKAEKIDSKGNIYVEKEFDSDGREKRVSNPYRANEQKVWTTNVYDDASRIIEVILPDGAKVKTDYAVSTAGVIGITKQVTDQAGKKRKGITDALGRMVRVIEDPSGQNLSTDYVFDTLGNLRKTIQGGQTRFFTYDSLGRLLRAKQPEQEVNSALALPAADAITGNNQWSVSYEYDDNGNITKTTDAENVSVTGTYDNLNRIKFRDYSGTTPDVSFFYDGTGLGGVPNFSKGKTTKVANAVSETRYTSFDIQGRLLNSEQRTPFDTETAENAVPRISTYQYDSLGKLVSQTYPSGRKVNYDYTRDGNISSIWGTVGAANRLYVNGITYNASGAMERLRLGNGKWETAKYNDRLQITEIALGNGAADTSLLKLEYGYGTSSENNGSMRSQKISFNGLSQPFEQVYSYDSLNRLDSAEEKVGGAVNWRQSFQYDRYGNRRFDAANTTTLSVSDNVTNPAFDAATNRIAAGQNYSYDKTGNLTGDAYGRQFLYDAENHQTEVKNAGGQTVGLYRYDGEGKRVKKISSTEVTIFVYDGSGLLVAEYSTQVSQSPQVSFLTQDHLGSARVITDELGNVTARKDYMAFGEEAFTLNRTSALKYGGGDDLRKGYTGYEQDDETGLDFAQARYYNPKHGRFTSVDPLTASANVKDPQTFNRYSYALNSPYKFTDPLGLIAQNTGANGGTAWCSTCKMSDDDTGWFVDPPQAPEREEPDTGVVEDEDTTVESDQQEAVEPDPPPDSPEKIDKNLATTFTDTGAVVGASGPKLKHFETGEIQDNHYQFANGVVHTIHVEGTNAGVFVPPGFTEVKITSKDTVVASNPKTGEVLMIAHVQVGEGQSGMKTLRQNMKTVRENGTIYIGKTGGKGGEGQQGSSTSSLILPHSHIQYHPNESERLNAYNKVVADRRKLGGLADFTQKNYSSHVSDFRNFVK